MLHRDAVLSDWYDGLSAACYRLCALRSARIPSGFLSMWRNLVIRISFRAASRKGNNSGSQRQLVSTVSFAILYVRAII